VNLKFRRDFSRLHKGEAAGIKLSINSRGGTLHERVRDGKSRQRALPNLKSRPTSFNRPSIEVISFSEILRLDLRGQTQLNMTVTPQKIQVFELALEGVARSPD
jgi:hypothetical protein